MAPQATPHIPYIGSKISLVSNAEIRYEGILHTLNTQESTISLQSVRCFGTEGRKEPEIPATYEVYDFIIFRGRDIKDLTVVEGSNHAQSMQMVDPAIMEIGKGKGKDGGGAKGGKAGKAGGSKGDGSGGGKGGDRKGGGKGDAGDAWGAKGDAKGAKGDAKGAKGDAKGTKGGKGQKGYDSFKGAGKSGAIGSGSVGVMPPFKGEGKAKGGEGRRKGPRSDAGEGKGKSGVADEGGNGGGEAKAKSNGRSRNRGRGEGKKEGNDAEEESRAQDKSDAGEANREGESDGDGAGESPTRPSGGRHRRGARRGGAYREKQKDDE